MNLEIMFKKDIGFLPADDEEQRTNTAAIRILTIAIFSLLHGISKASLQYGYQPF